MLRALRWEQRLHLAGLDLEELAEASVKSIGELNELIRGKPQKPDLKVIS